MAEKQNDMFATLMFQPGISSEELKSLGFTPENTGLKDKEYYKGIQDVQQQFKKENGEFDEASFSSFYDSVLSIYNHYNDQYVSDKIIDNYKFDPFDWRYSDAPKKNVSTTMVFDKNPMMNTSNIKAMNIFTESPFSIREIAQTNRVYDYEKNQWLDWSPNDKSGLFGGISRPSLVLATWDEDGVHEENGRMVQHNKGEYKYDPISGKPYYETIGNREGYNKDFLKLSDTLTKEGTTINKFDFFDSDGLDKSIGGSVMKLVTSIAPAMAGLALPEVGIIYGLLSASVSLTQLVPTLGKAINGFFTNDNENEVGRRLTSMENWASRFGKTSSDKSREKMVTFENAAGLIKDISMQLFQQRAIQQVPRMFKSNPKIFNNEKLARHLSYAYMSGTSALESYSAFKQAGADDRVAGLGMLATIGAFYRLMSIDYFRDSLFKGSWFDDNNVKSPVWNVAKDFMKVIANGSDDVAKAATTNTPEASARTLRALTTRIIDAIKRTGKEWRPSTFFERSFSEGVEEVMEEGFQDAIKATFKGAEALGIPMNDRQEELNFGFSGKDALQRYGMSFAGGLLGGAIFQGYNDLERWAYTRGAGKTADDTDAHLSEFAKLIMDGRSGEIKDVLRRWHNAGRFGATDLSATKLSTITGVDGPELVSNPTTEGISQNDLVYQILTDQITYMERVLEEEGFKNFETEGLKLLDRINPDASEKDKNIMKMRELGLHSLIYNDLNRLATKMVKIRGIIDEKIASHKPTGDTAEAKEEAKKAIENDASIKEYKERLAELRKFRDSIKDGDWDEYYVSQYQLMLNKTPLAPFVGFQDMESFIRANYGKEVFELTPEQLKIAEDEYKEYTDGTKKDIFYAIDLYRILSDEFSEDIVTAEKSLGDSALDSELGTTIIGNEYFIALKEKESVDSQLEELNKKETLTEAEEKRRDELKKQSDKLKESIAGMNYSPSRVLSNTTRSEENTIQVLQSNLNDVLKQIRRYDELNRKKSTGLTIEEDAEFNEILRNLDETLTQSADRIKTAYKEWGKNKVLKRTQSELDTFYELWKNIFHDKKTRDSDYFDLASNLVSSLDIDPGTITNPSEFSKKVLSLLDSFWDNVSSGNESNAIDAYNQLVEFLKGEGFDDESINDLLFVGEGGRNNALIGFVGNQTAIEFLKDLVDLKNNVKTSVLPEMIKKITHRINDSVVMNVFEMLDSEQKRLASKATLDAYSMSQEVYAGLKTALQLLRALHGTVTGASDGTNNKINKFRKDKKFAEISGTAGKLLGAEIAEYINRITFLLALHEKNSGIKLREHKEISVNMHLKWLEKLTSALHSEPFREAFTDKDGNYVDPKDLWENSFKPDNFDLISADNFALFEPAIIAFETELFKRVKALGFSQKEIVDKIMSLFGEDSKIWTGLTSRISSDPDTIITDYDFAYYLLTILTLHTNDFYVRFREKTKSFDKMPTYGHEYTLRMLMAYSKNTEAFNYMNECIAGRYTGSDPTLRQKFDPNNLLKNMLFALGGAGTGKTTSIARAFVEMIKDENASFVYMASGEKQVKNLATSANAAKDDVQLTYSTFFKDTYPDLLKEDDYEKKEEVIEYKYAYTPKEKTYHDSTKPIKILICDEFETLNQYQLQALSAWAQENGVFILALGDPKQPSGKFIYNKVVYESGLEDCSAIMTPTLTASLRTLSQAKNDNANKLEVLLSSITSKIFGEPETYLDPAEVTKYVKTQINSTNPLILNYYEQEDRMVGDRITSDETIFKNNLEAAIKSGKSVLIVNDETTNSKYQGDKYNNDKVKTLTVDDALGGEYDYVFMDIDLSESKPLLPALKELYMLSQRSTLYTCILDPGKFYSKIGIKSEENRSSGALISLSDEDLAEFKRWRLEALASLDYSEESEENLNLTKSTHPFEISAEKSVEEDDEEDEKDETESDTTSSPTSSPVVPPPSRPIGPTTPLSKPSETTPESTEEEPVKPSEEFPEEPSEESLSEESLSEKPEEKEEPTEPEETKEKPEVESKDIKRVRKPKKQRNVAETNNSISEEKVAATETPLDESKTSIKEKFVSNQDSKEDDKILNNTKGDVTGPIDSGKYYDYLFKGSFMSEEKNNEHSIFNKLWQKKWSEESYKKLILDISKICFTAKNRDDAKIRIKRLLQERGIDIGDFFEGDVLLKFEIAGNSGSTTISNIILEIRKAIKTNGESEPDFLRINIGQSIHGYTGYYTGWFKQTSRLHYERGERTSIKELMKKYPALYVSSVAGVFVAKPERINIDPAFQERNDGKAFVYVGESENPNYNEIFKIDFGKEESWAYSQSDKFKIIGIQKTLSPEEVITFLIGSNYFSRKNQKENDYDRIRFKMLELLGFTIGNNVDETKLKKTLATISGNSEWEYADVSELTKNDYIGTPATMSAIFGKLFAGIFNGTINYSSESSIWYNIRRNLANGHRLYINSGDNIYYIATIDKNNIAIYDENDNIIGRPTKLTVGNNMKGNLKTLIVENAKIDIESMKILFFYQNNKGYWNVNNTNYLLNDFLTSLWFNIESSNRRSHSYEVKPNAAGEKQIKNLFDIFQHGFYANIRVNNNENEVWKIVEDVTKYDVYTTDATTWFFSTYDIDDVDGFLEDSNDNMDARKQAAMVQDEQNQYSEAITSINRIVKTNGLLSESELSEILEDNEFVFGDNAIEKIQTIIDEINKLIISKVETKNCTVLKWDENLGDVSKVILNDVTQNAILNVLQKEKAKGNITDWSEYRKLTAVNQTQTDNFLGMVWNADKTDGVGFVWFDEDGKIKFSRTAVGKSFIETFEAIDSMLPFIKDDTLYRKHEGENRLIMNQRTQLKQYLIDFITDNVTPEQVRLVKNILKDNPNANHAILAFIEKRLNSEIDGC